MSGHMSLSVSCPDEQSPCSYITPHGKVVVGKRCKHADSFCRCWRLGAVRGSQVSVTEVSVLFIFALESGPGLF